MSVWARNNLLVGDSCDVDQKAEDALTGSNGGIGMQFDFNKVHDRRNTGSLKWSAAEEELPMWVADMDFQTAPAVLQAMEKKLQTGIFGYQVVTQGWNQAIMDWWSRRHHLTIQKEWLTFCTGVVPAVTCAVKRLTNVGDQVLVQTPVYDIFFHSIENHGRHVAESKLRYNGMRYETDFADLEEKLSHPLTTMMILCNPHNPIGRIWSREELMRIGELCKKHHVTVLSDEIHCDLTEPGYEYVPFAAASEVCREISITCISATKAFNLAGLQTAAIFTPNERIRNIMVRGLHADEIAEPGAFAVDAVTAAFQQGEEWLEELRLYLYENKKYAAEFLQQELPMLRTAPSNATYLLWLDCHGVIEDATELCGFLRKEALLYLSAGSQYRGNGGSFLRMNIACPRIRLKDGLERLKRGVEAYQKWIASSSYTREI